MKAREPGPSVALVHDWLVSWGGSEVVLRELARLFPKAPIYTSVWRPDQRIAATFGDRDVRPTFVDRVPGASRLYRWMLPAMPAAFAALDLERYDVVVSSSHAFSKAVRTRADALHVCYCHTPPRYLWDLASFYNGGLAGALRMPVVRWLRGRDRRAAAGVDRFVANSSYVADRIRRTYGRGARVVHPPVDVARFGVGEGQGGYYLAGGRMVAYKELDVVVEAANRERLPLRLFGDGPERDRLERLAGPTVELLGRVSDVELAELMAGCRAFLFPGVEDFGILPVEAQAAGRPVVARDEGGARETIVDGETGVLYRGDGPDGLLEGIRRLEQLRPSPVVCRRQAERFGREAFRDGFRDVLRDVVPGCSASPATAD